MRPEKGTDLCQKRNLHNCVRHPASWAVHRDCDCGCCCSCCCCCRCRCSLADLHLALSSAVIQKHFRVRLHHVTQNSQWKVFLPVLPSSSRYWIFFHSETFTSSALQLSRARNNGSLAVHFSSESACGDGSKIGFRRFHSLIRKKLLHIVQGNFTEIRE